MTARLGSKLLIQALIRRTEAEGGFATVLHKGDNIAGSIIIQTFDPNRDIRLFERYPDFAKGYALMPIAAEYCSDSNSLAQYIDRRIKSDPDLWIVELDVANAEQLADSILTGN